MSTPLPKLSLLVLALPLLGGSCKKEGGWDWREHFAVECMVIEDRGAVYVDAEDDLPKGAVVEVAELPELGDTVNNSRIYMQNASLVGLAAGPVTLHFKATSGEETAETSCQFERPVFHVDVQSVKLDTKPFARAWVAYELDDGSGAEIKPVGTDMDLTPEGNYLVGFKAWKPEVDVGGTKLEVDEGGVFRVPLPAAEGSKVSFTVSNPDNQSASYELRMVDSKPYADEDAATLRGGADTAYDFAAAPKDPRPEGELASTIVLDQDGEILGTVGPMRALSELEWIARVSMTTSVRETCKYAAPDGTTANIDRLDADAEVVLYEAKTGAKIGEKKLKEKAPRCPDAADFTVWKQDLDDEGVAWDQQLTADVMPKVSAWIDKVASK